MKEVQSMIIQIIPAWNSHLLYKTYKSVYGQKVHCRFCHNCGTSCTSTNQFIFLKYCCLSTSIILHRKISINASQANLFYNEFLGNFWIRQKLHTPNFSPASMFLGSFPSLFSNTEVNKIYSRRFKVK